MNYELEKGIVLKGVGSFYQVLLADGDIKTCQLRGKLRKSETEGVYPGDYVKISAAEAGVGGTMVVEGMIDNVLPRINRLLRPKVANIDQVLIVLAALDPLPDYGLVDKLLVQAECFGIEPAICGNKIDLLNDEERRDFAAGLDTYRQIGYPVFLFSSKTGEGFTDGRLITALKGKISVLAGASGVGKSSILNRLFPGLTLSTGDISNRLGRGKHTTRHVEMLVIDGGGLVADTPGFSLLDIPAGLTEQELGQYYPEFVAKSDQCRFDTCRHDKEPDCAIRDAVEAGEIDAGRYRRYLKILTEIGHK
ncbi:MAG: ribosome small subunit-dependent GTPase A [Clostridiales bacterium]|jgi:ribosome biogenesis GTPase|nr:ribosome small subunit-dependent GTPase A [Clostridiales bacterium]